MIELLKSLIFVRKCLLCGEVLRETKEGIFCPKCRLEYEKLKHRACSRCGKAHEVCHCVPPKLQKEQVNAVHLMAYEDECSKKLVFMVKRKKNTALFAFLGKELASLLPEGQAYTVTYAPRKPKSVREYGFDQAKCLAKALTKKCKGECVTLFRHARFSALQKNLNAAEREENAEKSYQLCCSHDQTYEHLLIVDDVLTTGSTMKKLIALAKEAGAQRITLVCIAHTAEKRNSHEGKDIEISSKNQI